MARIYIETSIVSYLKQRPSGQVIAAARQLLTRQWWDNERTNYELVTSQYVLDEAGRGDPTLATERILALAEIPLVELPNEIPALASEILSRAILPASAQLDALHIAATAYHELEYLLTWNCTHIANAQILPRIRDLLLELNYPVPIICTPEEMVGGNELDDE
jgi:predicted nucleic acid-binding protein